MAPKGALSKQMLAEYTNSGLNLLLFSDLAQAGYVQAEVERSGSSQVVKDFLINSEDLALALARGPLVLLHDLPIKIQARSEYVWLPSLGSYTFSLQIAVAAGEIWATKAASQIGVEAAAREKLLALYSYALQHKAAVNTTFSHTVRTATFKVKPKSNFTSQRQVESTSYDQKLTNP